MIWRNPKNEFEIESVELSDEEEDGDTENSNPPKKLNAYIQ